MRLSKKQIKELVRRNKITASEAKRLHDNPTVSNSDLLNLGLTLYLVNQLQDSDSSFNSSADSFGGGMSGGGGAGGSWDDSSSSSSDSSSDSSSSSSDGGGGGGGD